MGYFTITTTGLTITFFEDFKNIKFSQLDHILHSLITPLASRLMQKIAST